MATKNDFHVKGVVHVAINYRLGALGFTALEGEAWGNQGLRDQVVRIIIIIIIHITIHMIIIIFFS